MAKNKIKSIREFIKVFGQKKSEGKDSTQNSNTKVKYTPKSNVRASEQIKNTL